ncbi:hypothetical protein [Streptomyces nanshensis]|uniref:hypothetical protein n=1 Tax=Streptomyces nanshensis TaxID=518642 RepID=UPI00085C148D|nr:hypothetical protein [Streptomyces nanshensis]
MTMTGEQQYQPWGTVTPGFWQSAHAPTYARAHAQHSSAPPPPQQPPRSSGESTTPPPPERYRARIDAISAAARDADPTRRAAAAVDAERLDEEITRGYGQHHIHTIQIRELRGHLAHMTGDHETAVRWHLHTAALHSTTAGPSHPLTRAALRRAAHLWLSSVSGSAAIPLGTALLELAAFGDTDSELHRHLTARMTKLNDATRGDAPSEHPSEPPDTPNAAPST